MYCQQAAIAPQQNPFLYGDLTPEPDEIDYVGSTAKSQFSYDGLGHRMVDAETASGGGTTTTRYLWCGLFICQTRDGSDNVLRRDLTEGELNVSSGQKLVYAVDQLNSVRDVLDGSTGNLVQSYDYTPYGAVARSNGSTPTDYEYARLFAHPASGLNLSFTRALDGNTGRWLNRDPIRELASLNLYAYVDANAIDEVDPDGLCAQQNLNALCQALLASIQAQYAKYMAELNKYDPNTDWQGGFPISPRKGGGFTKPGGHYRKLGDLQRGLRNRIQTYYNLNCDEDDSQGGGGTGPISETIYDAATQPIQPPNYPTPQPVAPFGIPAPEFPVRMPFPVLE